MPRPSLKEERTEQIMQAFVRCVARYGLDGSTLERIAEEAELKRSLVRHFVGNREDMLQKLTTRVLAEFDQKWNMLLEWLPSEDRLHALLDALLASDNASDSELVLVFESLIQASGQNEQLRKSMQKWLQRFNSDIYAELQAAYPNESENALQAVTFGIISLYFNLDSLHPLGMTAQFQEPARDAADRLCSTLKKS